MLEGITCSGGRLLSRERTFLRCRSRALLPGGRPRRDQQACGATPGAGLGNAESGPTLAAAELESLLCGRPGVGIRRTLGLILEADPVGEFLNRLVG